MPVACRISTQLKRVHVSSLERVTFPLNNLESVPVRDFLLHSLICIIPALSNPCQPEDLFDFYFVLRGHCASPDSQPLAVHLGASQASITGALSSMWAVFRWQDFVLVCQTLVLRFPASK